MDQNLLLDPALATDSAALDGDLFSHRQRPELMIGGGVKAVCKLTAYPPLPLLNATSGSPVSISGGATLVMPSGKTGPLTVSDGTVAINGFVAPSVTNQPVTLRTIITPHYGAWPAGTVGFANNNGAALPHCGAVRVTERRADGIAICRTSFSPADNLMIPELTFTPANPSLDARSTNVSVIGGYNGPELMVSRDRTRTLLSAAWKRVVGRRRVVVTATIFPTFTGRLAPTGTVSFFNDGRPVKACAKEGLKKTTLTARCTLPSRLSGRLRITARYGGDGNFIASTSRKLRTTRR